MNEPAAANGMRLPIRAAPYRHQVEAFLFVCEMFGLLDTEVRKKNDGELSSVQDSVSQVTVADTRT